VALGDSLAVNGVCLTVEAEPRDGLVFHVGQETLERTTAGDWAPGRRLNLERALAVGDRLGGHLVQGHVDGRGTVGSVSPQGETVWLELNYPPGAAAYLVEKGSLAVDGVSLTVARVEDSRLSIAVIPHTWRETALGDLRPGSMVNLEYDLLGKYVVRFLELREGSSAGLTTDFLAEHGFL
jgi:riboflavin synthase